MRHDRFIMGAVFAALLLPLSVMGKDALSESMGLLKRLEGFRASVYVCQAGERAIGYGFTDSSQVSKGTITEKEADKVLEVMCEEIIRKVRTDFKGQRLTATQTAAIVSFAYNVGWRNYLNSRLRRYILEGKRGSVIAEEFRRWVYVTKAGRKVKSRGMANRRIQEARLFLK